MAKNIWYDMVAKVLILIGAVNWGLVGAFDFNLVSAIFGTGNFTNVVYMLVGVSGLYGFYGLFKK